MYSLPGMDQVAFDYTTVSDTDTDTLHGPLDGTRPVQVFAQRMIQDFVRISSSVLSRSSHNYQDVITSAEPPWFVHLRSSRTSTCHGVYTCLVPYCELYPNLRLLAVGTSRPQSSASACLSQDVSNG